MTETSNCVICGGGIRPLREALVAPFLARRIWGRTPFSVSLVECGGCGFSFYNPRLDAAEEERLYRGYRSDEYSRMRRGCEPWYTEKFNKSLAAPGWYERRRRKLREVLREPLGERRIARVLDHGGDGGDLVAGLFEEAETFVYDISGAPAVEGVKAVSDPASCAADLVINSNVLEHVGYPCRLVREILGATPKGGLVYLEVPCESPLGWQRLVRRVAQAGLTALARPSLALAMARPASLYLMHEHVNYFTERALTELMRACGAPIVASGSYAIEAPTGSCDFAWCLGESTGRAFAGYSSN